MKPTAAAAKAYSSVASFSPHQLSGVADTVEAASFGEILGTAMASVVESGKNAEKASMAGVVGKTDPVNVVTAVAETELALETMVSIRDKVVSAYEEILRMPI